MNNKSIVSIVRCDSYDSEAVFRSVAEAVDLCGGLDRILKHGDRVLLKPNLLNATTPEKAVVTHPEVLRAAIRAVRDFGAKPFVGEQPGIDRASMIEDAFDRSGCRRVCKEEGVACHVFRSDGYEEVEVPGAVHAKTLHVPRDVLESDAVFSLPKLKSHMQALYTGAIKNFYGCIPFTERRKIHNLAKYVPFSEGIVDILLAIRPVFGIMDAVVAMEGRGPSAGNPYKVGLILASPDMVALDSTALRVAGWDGLNVHHVIDAGKRGAGHCDPSRIEVRGLDVDSVAVRLKPPPTAFINPPRLLTGLVTYLQSVKPRIVESDCVECGVCAQACPADAISMTPKATIDYDKCIECFCCHELCPYGAVSEKTSFVARIKHRLDALLGQR